MRTIWRPSPASALAALSPARPPPTTTYLCIVSLRCRFPLIGRERPDLCDSRLEKGRRRWGRKGPAVEAGPPGSEGIQQRAGQRLFGRARGDGSFAFGIEL